MDILVNISASVKDDFDGDIQKVDKKPDEAGIAYYIIDSSALDTSKAGEYKVKVTAADKAGNEATKEFTVKVKAKKEDNSSSSSSATNSSSTSSKNNSTSGSKNNTSSSSKNNGTSNSNKGNTSSGSNNSGTSSNKPQQTCSQVKTKDAWDEQVLVSAAWDETVVDQAAWDEKVEVYKCNACGAEVNPSEWDAHRMADMDKGLFGGYSPYTKNIHHDAITHNVHHDAVYSTVHHDAEYTTVCK